MNEDEAAIQPDDEDTLHACPCCQSRTLFERTNHEVCPVCFWEVDGQDDRDADDVCSGPNRTLSLTEARANYEKLGACESRFLESVRPPTQNEVSLRNIRGIERAMILSLDSEGIPLHEPVDALASWLLSSVPGYSARPTDGVLLARVHRETNWLSAIGLAVMIETQHVEPFQLAIRFHASGQVSRGEFSFGDKDQHAVSYGSSGNHRLERELMADPEREYEWKHRFAHCGNGWGPAADDDCQLLPIAFRMQGLDDTARNALIDSFVRMIEDLDLQFGGGEQESVWAGFAEPTLGNAITPDQECAVAKWLASEQLIEAHHVGTIRTDSEFHSILKEDPDYPASQV